jgi:hypothetical protein
MEPNFSRFRLVLKQSASYLFIYPGCVGGWGGNGGGGVSQWDANI